MFGTLARVVVNRLFGCAHGSPASAADRDEISSPVQSRQPVTSSGGSAVRPSHHTSSVWSLYATLVKIVPVPGAIDSIAVGVVTSFVSRATPNTPNSGLIA